MTIHVQLTPSAAALEAQARAVPGRILAAIARVHDQQNELTVSHITRTRLSFPGTGPTTLEGLRRVSGNLARSLRRSRATISGNTVESSIGSNQPYMGIHEFGGTFTRKARAVRLRTNARGGLLLRGGRLATFAKGVHKRFRVVQAGAHKVTYPARAPIQKGLAERLPAYEKALSDAIVAAAQPVPGGA